MFESDEVDEQPAQAAIKIAIAVNLGRNFAMSIDPKRVDVQPLRHEHSRLAVKI
tara:strand:+ start:45 stop:206 length:162 start_codon:yes stop_codon:yes gene_type:complete